MINFLTGWHPLPFFLSVSVTAFLVLFIIERSYKWLKQKLTRLSSPASMHSAVQTSLSRSARARTSARRFYLTCLSRRRKAILICAVMWRLLSVSKRDIVLAIAEGASLVMILGGFFGLLILVSSLKGWPWTSSSSLSLAPSLDGRLWEQRMKQSPFSLREHLLGQGVPVSALPLHMNFIAETEAKVGRKLDLRRYRVNPDNPTHIMMGWIWK